MTHQIALVGCGRVAEKHLKAIRYLQGRKNQDGRPSAQLCALVDPNREARDSLADRFALPERVARFESLAEMYARATVQPTIVAITTPTGSHHALAKEALLNGCHVFVEKPITMKLADARELLELAGRAGLKIAVGHIYRFFPVVAQLQSDLQAGHFGKILYGDVKVRWGHDQAYYDQAAWRGTREADGGAIMNQSIHALDLMRWLLGEPELLDVCGRVSTQVHRMEAEDLGFGIFRLADNRWLALEGTTNTLPQCQEASFFLCCTQGEIRARLFRGKISMSIIDGRNKERKYRYLLNDLKSRIRREGWRSLKQIGNPHTWIYLDLLDSIKLDRAPLADGLSGEQALAWVLALYRSAGVTNPDGTSEA